MLFTQEKTQEKQHPYYQEMLDYLAMVFPQTSHREYWEKTEVDEGIILDLIKAGSLLSLPENANPYHQLYLDFIHELWKGGHEYIGNTDKKTDDEIFIALMKVEKDQKARVFYAMKRSVMKNIRYNYLKLSLEFKNGKKIKKSHLDAFFAILPPMGIGKNFLEAKMFIQDIIDENAFYPSIDWAKKLRWKGEDEYEGMFKAIGIEDNFMRTAFLTVCKSTMNRWAKPGSPNHLVPVIQSGQGKKKSTFIKEMSPLESFLDTNGFDSKDDLMKLHKHLLVEFGELEQITTKKDSESVKFFITQTKDCFRIPYGELPEDYQRAYSIWATANSETFLKDQTGSRRFVIIRLPQDHIIDIEWVREHREQFWAQIHQDKELLPYLPYEAEQELQERNKGFYVEDDLLERIEQILSTEHNLIATEHGKFRGDDYSDKDYPLQPAWLYRKAYRLGKDEQVSNADSRKISNWLSNNGYSNKKPNGKQHTVTIEKKQYKVFVSIPKSSQG